MKAHWGVPSMALGEEKLQRDGFSFPVIDTKFREKI